MINEIQGLVEQYRAWLKDRMRLREVGADWVEITTPYLDRHNDYLQIFVRRHNGGFVLTDDGYTITDLEQTGCKLDSPRRQSLLKVTLNGFGVQLNDGALEVHTSAEHFPLRKHNLIQAMLAVNDLFYLATPLVKSLFYEDVVQWLDLAEVRFTPKVKFTGKSGYDHLFDFVIPKSKAQPERILRAINSPSRDAAQALAFSWIDTKEVRPPDAHAMALLNDLDRTVSTDVMDALTQYDVEPILWSRRDSVRDRLVA